MAASVVSPVARRRERALLEELSTEHLVRHVRWHRAVKRAVPHGSPAWRAADAGERRLIAVLHRRFGVTTITPDGLDWLLSAGPRHQTVVSHGAQPARSD